MKNRSITQLVAMPYHAFDAHSGAHMLRAAPEHISPFIGIDSYTMPQPFFGPHPHAGMSAVTLMLPEADGGFINRDSLGDQSHIRPGDLHWTQAGRGMMHEEVPSEPGRAARGLQVFVNLARVHKQAEPAAFHIDRELVPTVAVSGGQVRVVAGTFNGQTSPIANDPRWLTPKFTVIARPKTQVAVGAMHMMNIDGDSLGVAYGAVIQGSRDTALTVGVGYAYAEFEDSGAPVVMIASALLLVIGSVGITALRR